MITSEADVLDQNKLTLPTIKPCELLGNKYIKKTNRSPHKVEVKEMLEDNKFLIDIADGEREEIMTYNELMDYYEAQDKKDDPEEQEWSFEDVLDHRKNKSGNYDILIKWSNREETWEPLFIIAQTDPVTIGHYAKDKDLLNTPQWKCFHVC